MRITSCSIIVVVVAVGLCLFVSRSWQSRLCAEESLSTSGVIKTDENAFCDWNYWSSPQTYRFQSPDLSRTGAAVELFYGPAADDFLSTETGPIHYIHIWGSFVNGVLPISGPESLTFQLSIYEEGDGAWGFGKTYYAKSTNGGESFSQDLAIFSSPDGQLNPVLDVDDQGTIHVAWENYADGLDLADIYYTHKMLDQGSFHLPLMVDDAVTTTSHQSKPTLSVAGSNVCLVWEDFRDDPERSRIYCSLSTNGGETFGKDFAVADGTDRQVNPSVVIDAQGTIHVVWEHYTGDLKNADIYYARKEPGQADFFVPRMVDDPVTNTTHQGNPELALHGQNIYVVWEDRRNDTSRSQIFYSWSADGGLTFSDDVQVFPGTDLQMNPALAVDGQGTLHVVCERFLDGLTADIYHAQKAAGQPEFSLPLMVDDPVTTTTHQTEPVIALFGDSVYVAWEDYRDNPRAAGIYFSWGQNLEFGQEFGADRMIDDPVTLTSHQMAPALAIDGQGTIHTVWQDYRTSDGPQQTESRFGPQLWSRTFGPGQYSVRSANGTSNGFQPFNPGSPAAIESDIYQYIFCIAEDAFIQQQGKTYWLEVSAVAQGVAGPDALMPAEPAVAFAWRTTSPQLRWRNPAIQWLDGGQPLPLSYPHGHSFSGHFLDLAFVIGGLQEGSALYDLGDAPDSSVLPMLAYPDSDVQAHFPTIFKSGMPPYGPIHRNPQRYVYLGDQVTLENAADIGADEDAGNNLDLPNGTSDQDGGDDGVPLGSDLPSCGYARLDYIVNIVDSPHVPFYVNIWFDWNRDGDWDDTIVCPDGKTVREWAVRNEELILYEYEYEYGYEYMDESGTSTFTTPRFRCWHPTEGGQAKPMWMRITLSEKEAPSVTGANKQGYGGSGPEAGYRYGETEDYLLYR